MRCSLWFLWSRLVWLLVFSWALPPLLHAQSPRYQVSPATEIASDLPVSTPAKRPTPSGPPTRAEAERTLASLPPVPLVVKDELVIDVLTYLAELCGMNYIRPEWRQEERTISFNVTENPFQLLKILAASALVSLEYDKGIWTFVAHNPRELLARSYKVRFSGLESVSLGSVGSGASGGGGGSGGSRNTNTPGGGSGFQGPGSLAALPSISINSDRLVSDLKQFLALSSSNRTKILPPSFADQSSLPDLDADMIHSFAPPSEDSGAQDENGLVIWNSDTQSVYVVANRQQHEWIADYLTMIDKPQRLISLEIFVVSTERDPIMDLGLDLSGTLADGYNLALTPPSQQSLPALLSSINSPFTAILSGETFQATLRFFASDRKTRKIEAPRAVTYDNRSVTWNNVTEIPILSGQTQVDSGGGATTAASITYISVGTSTTFLPKIKDGNKVEINAGIVISGITGESIIDGNSYPLTASNLYTGQMMVQEGETLVIGGLERSLLSENAAGLPWLRDIPVLGYLFGSKRRSNNRAHVLIYVTPTILQGYSGRDSNLRRDAINPEFTARSRYDGTPNIPAPQLAAFLRSVQTDVGKLEEMSKEEFITHNFNLLIERARSEATLIRLESQRRNDRKLEELASSTLDRLSALSRAHPKPGWPSTK